MKAQITLKSGTQIVVDAEDVVTRQSSIDGTLIKFEWETPVRWGAHLEFLNLHEVAAIVLLRDPSVRIEP